MSELIIEIVTKNSKAQLGEIRQDLESTRNYLNHDGCLPSDEEQKLFTGELDMSDGFVSAEMKQMYNEVMFWKSKTVEVLLAENDRTALLLYETQIKTSNNAMKWMNETEKDFKNLKNIATEKDNPDVLMKIICAGVLLKSLEESETVGRAIYGEMKSINNTARLYFINREDRGVKA